MTQVNVTKNVEEDVRESVLEAILNIDKKTKRTLGYTSRCNEYDEDYDGEDALYEDATIYLVEQWNEKLSIEESVNDFITWMEDKIDDEMEEEWMNKHPYAYQYK